MLGDQGNVPPVMAMIIEEIEDIRILEIRRKKPLCLVNIDMDQVRVLEMIRELLLASVLEEHRQKKASSE